MEQWITLILANTIILNSFKFKSNIYLPCASRANKSWAGAHCLQRGLPLKSAQRAGGRAHIYVLSETMISCTRGSHSCCLSISTCHKPLCVTPKCFSSNIYPKLAPFCLIFHLTSFCDNWRCNYDTFTNKLLCYCAPLIHIPTSN